MNDATPDSAMRAAELDNATLADLRLHLTSGVGPITRARLIARFQTAEEILKAPRTALESVEGVGSKTSAAIRDESTIKEAEFVWRICQENQIAVLCQGRSGYPRKLLELPDPPGVLFMRGSLLPEDELSVAMVGTRHCSRYGERQARSIAGGLARSGFTVVSGLARGIDGEAHRGVLEAGGRTVAVLGSGVLNIYPPEHVELAKEIAEHGAVISESPPLSPPVPGSFPQRNRIISGLSLGVLVVEAPEASGSLITARLAGEQGRDVFAMPGPVDNRQSRGCHRLLRDGAILVESSEDIVSALGPLSKKIASPSLGEVRHPAELQLNEQETIVLQAIIEPNMAIDDVVVRSGLPVQRVLSTLSVLEMRRLVKRLGGTRVSRA
jgi:DNA processing protein